VSATQFSRKSKAAQELAMHRVVCGPVSINASSSCRRRLRDTFDRLLDSLCEKCHEEMVEPEIPEGHELTEDGRVMSSEHLKKQAKAVEKGKKTKESNKLAAQKEAEKKAAEPTPEEKKKQLLEEAKMRMEVKVEADKYKEKLMGNSKLTQDISGKINKR